MTGRKIPSTGSKKFVPDIPLVKEGMKKFVIGFKFTFNGELYEVQNTDSRHNIVVAKDTKGDSKIFTEEEWRKI